METRVFQQGDPTTTVNIVTEINKNGTHSHTQTLDYTHSLTVSFSVSNKHTHKREHAGRHICVCTDGYMHSHRATGKHAYIRVFVSQRYYSNFDMSFLVVNIRSI